ncbi:MAG: hypothetical protein ABIC19_00295 [Patescibacteria group bacterium]|nr:hypothetical protein [Patescibacteria group bacterium]
MNNQIIHEKIKQKLVNRHSITTIIFVSIAIAALSFSVSTLIPSKYRSNMSVLVIQKQDPDKVDAYVATRSAEYLSEILARVIKTDSFIGKLYESPYQIESSLTQLPKDPEKRKEQWAKIVRTRRINNTGIIKISAYQDTQPAAKSLSQAIAWNLTNNGSQYHGGKDTVEVKLIDGPIVFQKPQPSVWLNSLLGLIVGLIASITGCYYIKGFNAFLFKNKPLQKIPVKLVHENTENLKQDSKIRVKKYPFSYLNY